MSAFLPLAFVLGALCGAALAWWIRSRRSSAATSPKRRTLIIVAATFVVTVSLTLATGYGVVTWKYRQRPAGKATVEQAVKDFRKAATNPPLDSAGASDVSVSVPAAGVYSYAASGFYQVKAPIIGTHRRDMPATVPGMLVASNNCWDLTLRYFTQHTWQARFCKPSKQVQIIEFIKTANEFMGRKKGGIYGCAPADIVRTSAKPGDTWMTKCGRYKAIAKSSAKTETLVTFVADEPVVIDGVKVPSRHMQRKIVVKGIQSGTTLRDLWFSKSTGLLLRVREHAGTTGLATFESKWQLTLISLTPAK